MDGLQVEVLIPALAGLATGLLVIGVFAGNRVAAPGVAVQRRIDHLTASDDADPLARSFAQRVLQPVLATILRVATKVLPTRIIAAVAEKNEVAGRPVTLSRFLTFWALVGVCVPGALAFAALASHGLSGGELLLLVVVTLLGMYMPWTWLRRKAQQRTRQIARDLPDAIDLIITNVEAGLGMQAALLTVSEKFGGPVGHEFGRVVREISVGAPRTETLVSMAQRTGVPEMRLFARAVAQAEQTGIPVARVLRNHSSETREKRRQLAREQAAKIPVKITIPTVLIMFPTLFLLILGPVAVNAMIQFGWR